MSQTPTPIAVATMFSAETATPPQMMAAIKTSSRSPPRNRLGRCSARCSGVWRRSGMTAPRRC